MIQKYRAWDKWNNKMWYSHEIGETVKQIDKINNIVVDDWMFWLGFEEGVLKATIKGKGFLVTDDPFPMYDQNIHELELLQWTTRKDKNKDDIYEGHILQIPYTYYDRIDCAIKVPYEEYILGVVTFNQEKACFGVVIPEDVDELSKGFNSFEMLFDVLGVECEVIGDKFNDKELVDWFESPELLEEAETK
jgi:uncharacterized phage protein (TIGR01671 family)